MTITNDGSFNWKQLKETLDSMEKKLEELSNDQKEKEWLTIKEAAQMINVEIRSIHNYKGRILPYTKIGGKVLFKRSDINEYLKINYVPVKLLQHGKD